MDERSGAHVQPSGGACGIIHSPGANRGQRIVAEFEAIPPYSEVAGAALVLGPEVQDRLDAQWTTSERPITKSVDGSVSVRRSGSITSASSRGSQASETQETDTTEYSSASDCDIDRQSFNSATAAQKRKRPTFHGRIKSGACAEDPIVIIDDDVTSEQVVDGAPRHKRKKRNAARRATDMLKSCQEKEPQWMSDVLTTISYLLDGNEAITNELRKSTDKITEIIRGVKSRDFFEISKSVPGLALYVNRMLDEKKTEREALVGLRTKLERWGAIEQRASKAALKLN